MSPFCMFDHDDCPAYIDGFCEMLEYLPDYDKKKPCPFGSSNKLCQGCTNGRCYQHVCPVYKQLDRVRERSVCYE